MQKVERASYICASREESPFSCEDCEYGIGILVQLSDCRDGFLHQFAAEGIEAFWSIELITYLENGLEIERGNGSCTLIMPIWPVTSTIMSLYLFAVIVLTGRTREGCR